MEDLEIPAGIQGNAVICKDQLALHFGSNQNGVRKPKCSDASGDFPRPERRSAYARCEPKGSVARSAKSPNAIAQATDLLNTCCSCSSPIRSADHPTPPPTDKKVS